MGSKRYFRRPAVLPLCWALALFFCALAARASAPAIDLPVAPDLRAAPPGQTRTPPRRAAQGMDALGQPQWLELDPGLEFGEFRLNNVDSKLTVLRINPGHYDFVLCAASAGQKPATLKEWAARENLAAAINASMYLPDGRTSTGYMRAGQHVNNGRIVDRFGAFFVAGPRRPGLPRAAIIDRDEPGWRQLLNDYDIVIQNYRMTNAKRRILWSPGGPLYAISAVAQDGEGRILFLHSQKPMEAYAFVQQLLHLPLDARTVMYVEGGAEAGLVVNSGGLKRELAAPHAPSLLVTGWLSAILPNVLGARPRTDARQGVVSGENYLD